MNNWISVEEQEPPKDEYVLTCGKHGIFIGEFHALSKETNEYFTLLQDGDIYSFTHWQPLPSHINEKGEQ